jgi:uracil-DNA glycosylase family 4
VAAIAPRALIALGATAVRSLLGSKVSVMRDRGHWFEGPQGLPVLVTLHPAAILRAERDAPAAYDDWLADLSAANRYGRADD